jgi:prepilin-type N-terminal cleavage/methylation domain-containing protein
MHTRRSAFRVPLSAFSTPRSAFTLIELLAVMAIMGLMMGLAVAAFKDMGRGTGMRGATLQFKTHMGLARQNAITRRTPVKLVFGNAGDARGARGFFYLASGSLPLSATNFMPAGVQFSGLDIGTLFAVQFKTDGSIDEVASDGDWNTHLLSIGLTSGGGRPITNLFRCYSQTGRVKVLMQDLD